MITEFIQSPVARALAWMLIHSLWQGLLIYVILKIVLRGLKGHVASLRYASGLVAMLVFLGWSALTFAELFAEFYPKTTGTAVFTPGLSLVNPGIQNLVIEGSSTSIPEWALLVWLAGVLVFSLKHLLGFYGLHRIRTTSEPPAWEGLEIMLEDLQQQMGISRRVLIRESVLLYSPAIFGLFKPLIVFPIGLVTGLNPRQVEAILLHELAHLKRQDYFINLLQNLIETIFFFNPFVWLISSEIREERENCCDDLVLQYGGDPIEYAEVLALITTFQSTQPVAPVLTLAGQKGKVYARIERLFNPKKPMNDKNITLFLIIVTLIAITSFTIRSITHESTEELSERSEALLVAGVAEPITGSYLLQTGKKKKTKKELEEEVEKKEDQLREQEQRIRELESRLKEQESSSRVQLHRLDAQKEKIKAQELRVEIEELRDKAIQEALVFRIDYDSLQESIHENIDLKELDKLVMETIDHIDVEKVVIQSLDDLDSIEMINQMSLEAIESISERVQSSLEIVSEALEFEHEELELNLRELEERMKEFEEQMHEAERIFKEELYKEGLIDNVNDQVDIHIRNGQISINGEDLPEDLNQKFIKIWEENFEECCGSRIKVFHKNQE